MQLLHHVRRLDIFWWWRLHGWLVIYIFRSSAVKLQLHKPYSLYMLRAWILRITVRRLQHILFSLSERVCWKKSHPNRGNVKKKHKICRFPTLKQENENFVFYTTAHKARDIERRKHRASCVSPNYALSFLKSTRVSSAVMRQSVRVVSLLKVCKHPLWACHLSRHEGKYLGPVWRGEHPMTFNNCISAWHHYKKFFIIAFCIWFTLKRLLKI